MKSTPVLVCIFLIICVTSAKNLTCYNCFYYEGHKNSEPTCQHNPKPSTAKVCSDNYCLPGLISVTAYAAVQSSNNNTEVFHTPSTMKNFTTFLNTYAGRPSTDDIIESKGYKLMLCLKFTGYVDKKPIVLRSCGFGSKLFDGKCTKNATITIEGRNATDVKACFCSTEKCNGANSPSGAYLLIAVAIFLHVQIFFK